MSLHRREFLKAGAAVVGALPFSRSLSAFAASDTLVAVTGQTINSLDLHRTGTNRASYQVAINSYDRLITFGSKTLEDGSVSFDYSKLEPELAESWTISDDGLTITFKLKPNAVFWGGSKVTAEVVSHGRHEKIKIVKFNRRKHYRNETGHRQWYTEVKITGIKG